MNAILPDDLSHYAPVTRAGGARPVQPTPAEDHDPASDWDGHSGLEMEPGTEMPWIGPEPLR